MFSGVLSGRSCSSTTKQIQPLRSRNRNHKPASPSENVAVLSVESGISSGRCPSQGHFDELVSSLVNICRLGWPDIVESPAGVHPASDAIVATTDQRQVQ